MEDVLKELASTKYWLLAFVSVVLSILANFITDWLKTLFIAKQYDWIAHFSISPVWGSKVYTIFHLYLVIISYLSMVVLGYYWIPLGMAFFFALDRSIRAKKEYDASLYFTAYIYVKTFFVLWSVPRITYYISEFKFVTVYQATTMLVCAFTSLWVLSRKKYKLTAGK